MAKLRRAGAPGATASSHTPSTASAASVPSAAVPPEPAYILKRVPLDRGALRNAGYLPEELFERRFADQFRQIKRPLIDKALAGNADKRLILVSSALPGDGKTFTSINLAFSMARERDVSVLLVDADAPRGRVSEVFGLRGERGLLDALSDTSVRVDSLIVETDVPGLQILPVGRFVEGATELFASTRMEEVAARIGIRDPRRLVLMDSAPLLVSSEGRALLRIPGQVILVARCGVTPRHAIAEAVALVDKSKIQGVVLNQASAMGGGYYNYGYGDEAAPEKYRD
jgi:exopolysaccharide/PEP-CTERM locus tyrosine autokinase